MRTKHNGTAKLLTYFVFFPWCIILVTLSRGWANDMMWIKAGDDLEYQIILSLLIVPEYPEIIQGSYNPFNPFGIVWTQPQGHSQT